MRSITGFDRYLRDNAEYVMETFPMVRKKDETAHGECRDKRVILAIDLLFFHRSLSRLVAFQLKVRTFQHEDIGTVSCHVEAVDRGQKESHGRLSIVGLLCATKDAELVEYVLARPASSTLFEEYKTIPSPKALLRRKLRELCAPLAPEETEDKIRRRPSGEFVQQLAAQPGRRTFKAQQATDRGEQRP
jgi:hypothetical protein